MALRESWCLDVVTTATKTTNFLYSLLPYKKLGYISLMADPGIFDWERGPSFGLERTVELFVANYFSRRQPRVSQSVNAGRRWRGKYCFASGGEQITGGTEKQ